VVNTRTRSDLEIPFTYGNQTTDSAYVTALPLPLGIPAGVLQNSRVTRLIDMNCVSHGLAWGASSGRAPNQRVQSFLDTVQATACALDPRSRVRYAASTATAAHHLDLLLASENNQWSFGWGRGRATQVLLDEMNDLIAARLTATEPGRRHGAQPAQLVILAGQDRIYAPPVRQLRLLGIPTWLIVPGCHVAKSLRSSACAMSIPDLYSPVPCSLPLERQS
jgi:hypothetical protein